MKRKADFFSDVNRLMHGGRRLVTPKGGEGGEGGGGEGGKKPDLRARTHGGDVAVLDLPTFDDTDEPSRIKQPGQFQVVEPEDAIKAIHDIRDVATRLAKRGELAGGALVKLTAAVKTLDERMKQQATNEQRSKLVLPGSYGADGTVDLRSAALRLKPPRRMDPLYFNLMANTPDELSFAARAVPKESLTPQLQMFLRRRGLNDATKAAVLEAQAINDAILIADLMLSSNPESQYAMMPRARRIRTLRIWQDWKGITEALRDSAMDTATAGEGTEWVPTILSSQLHTLIYAELALAGFFEWPTMPSKVWEHPVEGADAIAYLISEGLDDPAAAGAKPTASIAGTRKLTLTAKKFAARVVASVELTEDAAIDMAPHILTRVARAIARGREKAIVDGQLSGTIDTADVPGATDVRSAWDGLRKVQKLVGAALEVDAAVLSAEVLAQMKGVLKEYGQMPDDGLWVGGYSSFIRLLTLYDKTSGGTPMLLTQDKLGAGAVFPRGQLGLLYGSPFVVSQFVREDLNASGIYDNVTVTKTILLYANRRAFQGGERRATTVRRYDELKAETDQILVMGTYRAAFAPVNYAGTQRFVALGRNIASF